MNGAKGKVLKTDIEHFEERLALVSHPSLLPQSRQEKLFSEKGEIQSHVISHH